MIDKSRKNLSVIIYQLLSIPNHFSLFFVRILKNMKFLLLLFLILTILSINSNACTRTEFGVPACGYFTRADVVFLGKAIKVENVPKSEDYPANGHQIRFQVLQNFKGADNPNFSVITSDWKSACGLNVKKGETWLIYANYDVVYKSFSEFRGVKIESQIPSEEVETVKDILAGKTDTAISGQFVSYAKSTEYIYEPVEITVEGKGKKFTAQTDANGAYNIPVPSDGTYKVELKFPFKANLMWDENLLGTSFTEGVPSIFKYEARLNDGDCHFSFFQVLKRTQ